MMRLEGPLAARLRATLRRGRGAGADDTGSAMLLVMMAVLIVSSLSILLLGSLIAQSKPIPVARKAELTVNAAQAGFDAVLSQIRASTKLVGGVKVQGDATKLPCYSGETGYPPLTGTVSGTMGTANYSVQVNYYQQDPSDKLGVWRSDPTNIITCSSTGAAKTPAYAYMVSTGSTGGGSTSGDRTLATTYQFSTDNTNVAGGPIHLYGLSQAAQSVCWDAGTTIPTNANPTPPNPWNLSLNTCYSGAPQQSFQYRKNYSIVLGVTATTDKDGYCLTAPASVNQPLTLRTCDPTNAAGLRGRQEWGVDASDRYYVTFGGNSYRIDGIKAGASSQDIGAMLYLSSGGRTWTADPSVGPGNGGAPIGEMANYALFGNCFDVSNWDLNWPFMILYPCKQPTPNSGDTPDANQIIKYDPVNKWLFVDTAKWNGGSWKGTGTYCFVAPTTEGGYVVPKPCSTVAANQKWVQGNPSRYSTAFTLVSTVTGKCLAAGPIPPDPSDSKFIPWPTVIATTCTGDTTQKWNADPNFVPAGQDDTVETTGS
jgi:hypothetical protein